MARTASTDEGATDPLMDQSALRKELADGMPEVSPDPQVPKSKLMAIACVRSLIMCMIIVGGLCGLAALLTIDFGERHEEFSGELVADLCGASNSSARIRGRDGSADDWLDTLKSPTRKSFSFVPVGIAAKEAFLPTVDYFISEEVYLRPRRHLALSFGFFRINPMTYRVTLKSVSCVKKDVAADRFARAIFAALKDAGRRLPRKWLTTTPFQMHGALVLRADTDAMWDSQTEAFEDAYEPSDGWVAYQVLVQVLRLALASTLLYWLGVFVFVEYGRAVDDWIVQYDTLWSITRIQQRTPTKTEEELKLTVLEEGEVKEKLSRFCTRVQICGPFFVIDYATGNAIQNSEQWLSGLVSSLIHGLLIVAWAVFPVVGALFVRKTQIILFGLLLLHGLAGCGFGICYYFTIRFRHRRPFLFVHLVCIALCLVCATLYFTAVLIFLLTRLIVSTKEALALAVPVATIAMYVIVVSSELKSLQNHYVAASKGKEPKGSIYAYLTYIGVSTGSIIWHVLSVAISLLLLTAVLLLGAALYSDNPGEGDSNPLAAVIVPIASVVSAVQTIQKKKKDLEEVLKEPVKAVKKIA